MYQEAYGFSAILLEISKTIQVIGIDNFIEILKIARTNKSNITEEVKLKSQSIIKIVCDEFKIDVDDFYSRTRKNNRRYAIGITAMLLKKHINLDNADISFLLKKPNNLVSIYCNEVYELNPKHKSDIYIIELINNINTKLKN